MTFVVDTGAGHSVVSSPVAPVSTRTGTGASGRKGIQHRFCQTRQWDLRGHKVPHELLYWPDRPIPLPGPDLFPKLRPQIHFEPTKHMSLRLHPRQEEAGSVGLAVTTPRDKEWRLCGAQAQWKSLPEPDSPSLHCGPRTTHPE